MAVDRNPRPSEGQQATETSPLLGQQQHADDSHPAGPAAAGDGVAREGLPEMAKKLHILLPAMGIGMFLCALDQLLVVATYAKISSDLQALNRTSWVSTA